MDYHNSPLKHILPSEDLSQLQENYEYFQRERRIGCALTTAGLVLGGVAGYFAGDLIAYLDNAGPIAEALEKFVGIIIGAPAGLGVASKINDWREKRESRKRQATLREHVTFDVMRDVIDAHSEPVDRLE